MNDLYIIPCPSKACLTNYLGKVLTSKTYYTQILFTLNKCTQNFANLTFLFTDRSYLKIHRALFSPPENKNQSASPRIMAVPLSAQS